MINLSVKNDKFTLIIIFFINSGAKMINLSLAMINVGVKKIIHSGVKKSVYISVKRLYISMSKLINSGVKNG